MTDQTQRVTDAEMRISVRIAEKEHAKNHSVMDRFALDLRDSRAREKAKDAIIADYEAVLADKRRLARELDIAMHGEEGAAEQASLCDLIQPAANMRATIAEQARLVNELLCVINRDGGHALTGDLVADLKAAEGVVLGYLSRLDEQAREIERLERLCDDANHELAVMVGAYEQSESALASTTEQLARAEALIRRAISENSDFVVRHEAYQRYIAAGYSHAQAEWLADCDATRRP